jgi:hypothetical protein
MLASTLERMTTGLTNAMRRGDRLTVESYRMLKARALQLALSQSRHTATENDARAAVLAWRAHLLKLLRLYVTMGAAGELHSDRLVHDVAQCDEVVDPNEPMTAELSALQRAAEAALREGLSEE